MGGQTSEEDTTQVGTENPNGDSQLQVSNTVVMKQVANYTQ